MIVGRFGVKYDRGKEKNEAEDLGLDTEPAETPDGGLVCGLGTHYRDAETVEAVKRCVSEERRIRVAIKRTFVASPIPGVYVLPTRYAGQQLLDSLNVSSEVQARCAVYDLTPGAQLPDEEIAEWCKRIRMQLDKAPLGNKKEIDAKGFEVLEKLIACPVLKDSTAQELSQLIAAAKCNSVSKVDFKRRLAEVKIDVEIGPVAAPRRVAAAAPIEVPQANAAPRRRRRAAGAAAAANDGTVAS